MYTYHVDFRMIQFSCLQNLKINNTCVLATNTAKNAILKTSPRWNTTQLLPYTLSAGLQLSIDFQPQSLLPLFSSIKNTSPTLQPVNTATKTILTVSTFFFPKSTSKIKCNLRHCSETQEIPIKLFNFFSFQSIPSET